MFRVGRCFSRIGVLLLTPPVIAGCASSGGSGIDQGADVRITRVNDSNGGVAMQLTNNDPGIRGAVPGTPSAVWAALPGAFRALGLPGTVVSASRRIYGSDRYLRLPSRIAGRPLSYFFDCDAGITGSAADRDRVYLRTLTQVDSTAGGAVLETHLDAFSQPRITSGNSVVCGTNGRLEKLLADSVRARVGRAGKPQR